MYIQRSTKYPRSLSRTRERARTYTHAYTSHTHIVFLASPTNMYTKRPISIQITYYTNVRKLCRYYNMFESISFVMYNVESILLSSYVVWRNDLLIHTIGIYFHIYLTTMLFDRFIIPELFLTLVVISLGIKRRTDLPPYYD